MGEQHHHHHHHHHPCHHHHDAEDSKSKSKWVSLMGEQHQVASFTMLSKRRPFTIFIIIGIFIFIRHHHEYLTFECIVIVIIIAIIVIINIWPPSALGYPAPSGRERCWLGVKQPPLLSLLQLHHLHQCPPQHHHHYNLYHQRHLLLLIVKIVNCQLHHQHGHHDHHPHPSVHAVQQKCWLRAHSCTALHCNVLVMQLNARMSLNIKKLPDLSIEKM